MLLAFTASAAAQQSVHYELSFPNAVHHEAEIRATFTGVRQPVLRVWMSRSSPGRYSLHEFGKNVYNVRAFDGTGHPAEIRRGDPYSWEISGHDGTVIIQYTLFGDRTDGTYAAIDEVHAHLNTPAALVWAEGYEHAPATLKFHLPKHLHWKIATQLLPSADETWSAPNLERLMDSPIEISKHDEVEWKVEDSTFRLALHHEGKKAETHVFGEMCKAVVMEEEGVFGGLPKYDGGTYTFLIDYLPYANGDGMEHRDSTVITGSADFRADPPYAIGTVAHEFFHSWNVKRIRPRSLEPFDFERANMSGELWFAEGFTSYYGPLVLQRAGISKLDEFVSEMSRAVNLVLTSPGRKLRNVIEMSELAPYVDAAHSLDPNNFANTFISYYPFGEALALGIDLQIRERFPGKSLDNWMQAMWREHPDIDKPYTLEDLQNTLGEVTDASFAAEVFRRHINGKDSIDYAPLLARAGLVLRKQHPGKAWLGGAQLEFSASGIEISSYTLRGTPLYEAGLDKGDTLASLDGKKITSLDELDTFLARCAPGDRIDVKAYTRAGQEKTTLTLADDPAGEIVTYEKAGLTLTPEMRAFRSSWLSSRALHPLPRIPEMP